MNAAFNYQQTADAQYQKDLISALDQEVKCAKTGYAPSLSLALRSQLLIDSWDPITSIASASPKAISSVSK